jgi:hypothetical protein
MAPERRSSQGSEQWAHCPADYSAGIISHKYDFLDLFYIFLKYVGQSCALAHSSKNNSEMFKK